MRSIKPGRAPSAMNAFGSLIVIVFGIGWTILAYYITRDLSFPLAGILFPLFGVLFVLMGIVNAAYHLTNARAKRRFSTFDITDDREEPDPLNRVFGEAQDNRMQMGVGGRKIEGSFCPYCGAEAQPDFDYCPKCGKDI